MALAALEKMREVMGGRHEYAKEWQKRTGRQVIGYLCTWVPEELIYAGGALPVRILGSHEPQDVTEPHIYGMFCSYCRDVLAQGLLGRYHYLDGIVYAQGCYHIRQAYDAWVRHVGTPWSYYFYTPTNIARRGAGAQIVRELEAFQPALEQHLGRKITPNKLERVVNTFNTNRRLMRKAYQLRKAELPLLAGSEALSMVYASQVMDKVEHNRLMRELLGELLQRPARRKPLVRVMLIGSELDDPGLYYLIEELGGEVVIDDNCMGTRYFWNDIQKNGTLFQAIADRYVHKPPCPVYDYSGGQSLGLPTMGEGERRRLPYIKGLAQEYDVDGAIVVQLKFCDPHEYDVPAIQKMLEELGVPTLKLELDITVPVGQFRTRIEAFFETLVLEV